MNHNFKRNSYVLPFQVARFLFILPLLAIGCAHLFGSITYYDPTTYKNLTDLKPEVIMLYRTFTRDSIDSAKFDLVRLKLSQIYEYEKGKGSKNIETCKQVEIINKIYERHVKDRITNGKWNQTNLRDSIQNISEAFDIAIQTEYLKNKNEP